MPLMKIENLIGETDTFTWTYNPNVFDASSESNHTTSKIAFQKHHIISSGDGIEPRPIILTGHTSGASKRTEYRSMKKHFNNTKRLKKLYFQSDKFYLGVGQNCKETDAGGRTNFIDYVASFISIIGISLGSTEKTSGTNAGDVQTYVTEIRGIISDGGTDITISDGCGNIITVDKSELTTGQAFIYLLVQMVLSGAPVYTTEYGYCGHSVDNGTTTSTSSYKLVDSGQADLETTVAVGDLVYNATDKTKTIVTAVDSNTTLSLYDDIMASGESYIIYHQIGGVTTTTGVGLLSLNEGANISTVSPSNLTSITKKFRDGWCD